jgi:hypothetical protein
VKRGLEGVKAEESPLLEAIAREQMMKAAGWKRLSRRCDDLWRLSGAAVITCTYKLSINPTNNPNPV